MSKKDSYERLLQDYTTDLASAGVYDESEALAIVRRLGPEKGARLIPYRQTTLLRARFAAWLRRAADRLVSGIPASS